MRAFKSISCLVSDVLSRRSGTFYSNLNGQELFSTDCTWLMNRLYSPEVGEIELLCRTIMITSCGSKCTSSCMRISLMSNWSGDHLIAMSLHFWIDLATVTWWYPSNIWTRSEGTGLLFCSTCPKSRKCREFWWLWVRVWGRNSHGQECGWEKCHRVPRSSLVNGRSRIIVVCELVKCESCVHAGVCRRMKATEVHGSSKHVADPWTSAASRVQRQL